MGPVGRETKAQEFVTPPSVQGENILTSDLGSHDFMVVIFLRGRHTHQVLHGLLAVPSK